MGIAKIEDKRAIGIYQKHYGFHEYSDLDIGDIQICYLKMLELKPKLHNSELKDDLAYLDNFIDSFELSQIISPKHYDFNIKGVKCDLFDIADAMGLSPRLTVALRYFRNKTNKVEDLKKAIKCIEREIDFVGENN